MGEASICLVVASERKTIREDALSKGNYVMKQGARPLRKEGERKGKPGAGRHPFPNNLSITNET